jgi:LCP family protein required for cell wall assembly
MKTFQRQKARGAFFLAGIVFCAVFFAFHVSAESIVPDGVEHIDSYGVVMDVGTDANISVAETIDYNFGNGTKSGISRYIPLNYQDLSGTNISIKIDDVSVSDESGNQYVFNQSQVQSDDKKKNYLKIDIGDGKQQFSGNKIYIIRYIVSGAIRFSNDHDELFWNMTGDRWPVYIKYPEVKINFPQRIDRDSISKRCFIGLPEATVECIDRINGKKDPSAYYSYKGVVSGEGMTTIVDFPKGIVQKRTAAQESFWSMLKTDRRMQGAISLGVLFFAIVIIGIAKYFSRIARFFSKENRSRISSAIVGRIKLSRVHAHVKKIRNKSRKWWITAGVILAALFISGEIAFWKIETTLNKISVKGESIGSIVQAGIGSQNQIKGESEGRINVLLLGILGANHQGGGLNTDTIMVASISPKENKMSLVSIPRDLWVTDPGKDTKSKINAVYAYGEEKGPGQGITDIESMVSDIAGIPIHYAAMVSTDGFKQLIDTLGGVEVELAKPFNESSQFTDIQVCDSDAYTIPTGEFQYKKDKKKKIVAQYPLCKNSHPECGGTFSLPAGKSTLSGEKALCFIRSRYLTSDFERAKRQQLVLQQLRQKVVQLNLADFAKVNSILDNLGDNVKTDMQLWEMRKLFDLYNGMDNPKIYQRVLEDSKEGLLYSPDKTPETGFILLPRGDNYDKIRILFQNIFNSGSQSDIKPKI